MDAMPNATPNEILTNATPNEILQNEILTNANINYTIADSKQPEPFDIKLYAFDLYKDEEEISFSCGYDELNMLYMSYSVRSLVQILNYYGINKKKLVKTEMIQILVLFELDINNTERVLKRWRLWKNIEELSLDTYFKQFVCFTV